MNNSFNVSARKRQQLSSSDDSLPKNHKSESICSIDTQSVNNILDEYDDFHCKKSSTSTSSSASSETSSKTSGSSNVNVNNFEALMDKHKRQQLEQMILKTQVDNHFHYKHNNKSAIVDGEGDNIVGLDDKQQMMMTKQSIATTTTTTTTTSTTTIPVATNTSVKVNQQTQVRQKSRQRNQPKSNYSMSSKDEKVSSVNLNLKKPTFVNVNNESQLLRRGEVQKRVDEWLNQNHQTVHQKVVGNRAINLTRSNSSAEQKKRYNNNSINNTNNNFNSNSNSNSSVGGLRSGLINDKVELRLSGTTSCDNLNSELISRQESNNLESIIKERLNISCEEYNIEARNRFPHHHHHHQQQQPQQQQQQQQNTRKVMVSRIPQSDAMINNYFSKCCEVRDNKKNQQQHHHHHHQQFEEIRQSTNGKGSISEKCDQGRLLLEEPDGCCSSSKLSSNGNIVFQVVSSNSQRPSSDSPNKAIGESKRSQSIATHQPFSESFNGIRTDYNNRLTKQVARRPPAPPRRNPSSDRTNRTSINNNAINNNSSSSGGGHNVEQINRFNDQQSLCSTFKPPPPPPASSSSSSSSVTITTTTAAPATTTTINCNKFRFNPDENANGGIKKINIKPKQCSTAKTVKKIYEKSLCPEVIHADDVLSAFTHVPRPSLIYDEDELVSCNSNDHQQKLEVEEDGFIQSTSSIVTTNFNSNSINNNSSNNIVEKNLNSEELSKIYPEIGIDQCLKLHKKIPKTPISFTKDNNKSLITDVCWKNNNKKCDDKCEKNLNSTTYNSNKINYSDNIDQQLANFKYESSSYLMDDDDDHVAGESYEAKSTLKIDRKLELLKTNLTATCSNSISSKNTTTTSSCSLDDEKNNMNTSGKLTFEVKKDNGNENDDDTTPRRSGCSYSHHNEKTPENRCRQFIQKKSTPTSHPTQTIPSSCKSTEEMDEYKRNNTTIVSDILVKNLCFEQEILNKKKIDNSNLSSCSKNNSKPIEISSTIATTVNSVNKKPFNFNSVLSDDYENIRINQVKEKTCDTKEEIERQRLMNLLRNGDYESVKLELERSYALSTPGSNSPIGCPPCSPPPAPAAFISSASSRRLGSNSIGPSSPNRDPVGKLLRYLKTFYRELATREPRHLPSWTSPLPAGTLCPAHFQPHLQIIYKNDQENRLETIKIDQIFSSVKLSDGMILESPRRVAIEGGPGSGRTTLCLKILHQWATHGDGPALVFLIPLRELRGNTMINYLTKDFLPKTAGLNDAMLQVWRTLHLLEDRVLFILDGYDECLSNNKSHLGDAIDLLESRLFPDARILITCSSKNLNYLSQMVQRKIHLNGLEWLQIEKLCVAYLIHNNLSERTCEFIENLNIQNKLVKEFVQHPLGWIMLCLLYHDKGYLPNESNILIQQSIINIVKKSINKLIVGYDDNNDIIPIYCKKKFEEFGKLALLYLRDGKFCYNENDIKQRGGGIDIIKFGFLTKGFIFGQQQQQQQRKKTDIYTPIHLSIVEYLSAYYLTSIAQYSNILRRELEGLPNGIIGHLAALLGPKTYLILNQLCPLEVPSRMIFSLLKAGDTSDGNISAVCRLLGAAPTFGPIPNEKSPAPLVQTSPLELEGWTKILNSNNCTLEALEIIFQIERGSDPIHLNEFFNALSTNESIKLVRITSLLGQEYPADEAQLLSQHLTSVLSKKKLHDFELVITCLEESAHDRVECVVNALCRGLINASCCLTRLVLDMNLTSEQVSKVCEALRNCVQVQALHLPHLSCGSDGLASVAELIKERPLFALNLAGSWGAKNEDPSSSGISMGSGSGSSGCASSTLGTLPLNRCYSSLPRGTLAAYGSLTRPATLPRLPLGISLSPGPTNSNSTLPVNDRDKDNSNSSSKRNSDSVLCHRLPVIHSMPTCDTSCHQGTGFHEIFTAIRDSNCKLRSLNVSKCLQGSLDAVCLAETIRRARNLDAVRAAGISKPVDVMSIVLALNEAPCIQLLDLASPRLAMDDHPSRLLCHSLARNETLRLLSLEGWTFRIEESESLAVFSELLICTSIRELNLSNARLHLAVHEGPLSRLGRRDDAGAELLKAAPPPICPSIVFLRLAGFQVTVNDRLALRGPLLLPFLGGFTALNELDLSLDKSEIGGNISSTLFIDDKLIQQFFNNLINFKCLQTLIINYWRITLENADKTMKQLSKSMKLCNLNYIKINNLIVNDSYKRQQIEHVFIQTILANIQNLNWLSIDNIKLTELQSSNIGKWIKERYPGNLLEISAKDINVKSIKALVSAVENGARAQVTYIGGSTCRIKIIKFIKNHKNKKK